MSMLQNAELQKSEAISVIVPVFNSEATLWGLTKRLEAVLAETSSEFEIIFVNDRSSDNSSLILGDIRHNRSHVSVYELTRNFGQHNALLLGIRKAKYPLVVTIDDDLQNPPEELGRMLAELQRGFDVVYGAPEKEQHSLGRNISSRVTKLVLQRAMGIEAACHVSAFRVFRTEMRQGFDSYSGHFVSIDVLLTWSTTSFSWVSVRQDPRAAGMSQYTLKKLVEHALNMVTGFSILPLQVASMIGLFCTLLGVLLFCYVVGRAAIQGSPVPGFPFIASAVCLFSGAQLFALGIIGEYLARMHFALMGKPSYVVREGDGSQK